MQLSPSDFHDDATPLDDDALDAVARALEKAEDEWNSYTFLATPKMPCPECGGTGRIFAGSLGDACPNCGGARVIDRPDGAAPDGPDFVGLRQALGVYSRALADQQLPEGHVAKRGLALPPASTIVRPEAMTRVLTQTKQLAAGVSVPEFLARLPEHKKQVAGSLGDEDAEFSDDELDEIQDDE